MDCAATHCDCLRTYLWLDGTLMELKPNKLRFSIDKLRVPISSNKAWTTILSVSFSVRLLMSLIGCILRTCTNSCLIRHLQGKLLRGYLARQAKEIKTKDIVLAAVRWYSFVRRGWLWCMSRGLWSTRGIFNKRP